MSVVVVVASEADQQKAAPLGLFVLILLGVACYFLFKSMSRHLRRVRDDFPAAGIVPGQGAGSADIVGEGDPSNALTRPAPVTLTRGRAAEPQLIQPPAAGPRVIEPRVIEPRVIEPRVIEPRVIEPDGTDPGRMARETDGRRDPEVES
jgi:hypothetical protein